MKFWLGLLVVLFVSFAVAEEKPVIHWQHNYAHALEEAKRQNKPVLVFFTTTPCIWCERLLAEMADKETVQHINSEWIAVKVNIKHSPNYEDLARSAGVKSFPTVILAAPDTKLLATQEGFLENKFLLPWLRSNHPKASHDN